jgi:two-component system, OmpR family, phosphate regulon response regulator PhoB
MSRILIVEDEPDAAELLRHHFSKAGHEISVVEEGGKGLTVARTTLPDLIILDHMLPGMSGTEIVKVLRSEASTRDIPIIMLTARAAEDDRVRGFESGADDYVTKPYSVRELLLRVSRHLERRKPVAVEQQKIVVGDMTLDLTEQTVNMDDQAFNLTHTEFKFLLALARQVGQAVSRQTLLKDVWNYGDSADSRTVDSHVRRLRQKLGREGLIQTVTGVGYRLKV